MALRVRTVGALLLFLTLLSAVWKHFLFHPIGYVVSALFVFPALQWNSLIRINSFSPERGAPKGVLLRTLLSVKKIRDGGKDDDDQLGRKLLRSLAAERPRVSSQASLFSITKPRQSSAAAPMNTQDRLEPWQRLGVSLTALDAFRDVYAIDDAMTTDAVCERIIKPRTYARQCCFIDLLHGRKTNGWLGKPNMFVSHWWGYSFVTLLEMIHAHEKRRKAVGEPPAYYFFDIFVLNQWQLFRGCTSDEAKREQLVISLRQSLIACGRVLLCCAGGPSGLPGWESPAVLRRVWCLFEVFHSIREGVEIVIQLGPDDEAGFWIALNKKDGPSRVKAALDAIQIEDAHASVEADKQLIKQAIMNTTGVDEFDSFVRAGLASEYRRISANSMAHGAAFAMV